MGAHGAVALTVSAAAYGLLARSRVTALPNLTEAMSVVLADSMASGMQGDAMMSEPAMHAEAMMADSSMVSASMNHCSLRAALL